MTIERITIHGYLVGGIWWPYGAECYKDLSYDILREQDRTVGGKMTLREHVLRATNDGDFQSCEIADGYLEIRIRKPDKTGRTIRTRMFPLDMFPSISDCVKSDWSGPEFED